MLIPSVADLAITGPFSVIDADAGRTLHEFTPGTDAAGYIPPDAAQWPALSITADAGRVIIITRAPKTDPAADLLRARREYLRKQAAPYTPGTRRLY